MRHNQPQYGKKKLFPLKKRSDYNGIIHQIKEDAGQIDCNIPTLKLPSSEQKGEVCDATKLSKEQNDG